MTNKCAYCPKPADWKCENCGKPICEVNHAFTFDDDTRAICTPCNAAGARQPVNLIKYIPLPDFKCLRCGTKTDKDGVCACGIHHQQAVPPTPNKS